MNIDDLRRRAEQALAADPLDLDSLEAFAEAANPQAILALLDERNRAYAEGMSDGRLVESATRKAAERRVTALEEQIDAIREAWEQRHVKPEWMDGVDRALLTAAPSEPPDECMCPNCVTPWKCNGPHIPAALPAEADRQREVDRQTQALIDGWSEASDE